MLNNVINKSTIGEALARPGYKLDIFFISSAFYEYIRAPPMGTIKFLSVLETIKSTLECFVA